MTRRKPSPVEASDRRTFGYCRVSTTRQAESGHSLADQQTRISGYCQANGLPPVTEFFVDATASGTVNLQKREAGARLLDVVRRGDHIIVTKGDRLFRSAKNALDVAETLRERGVSLHLMDMGGEILNSSVSRMVFGILMMVANMEAERIGERTAAVKEHRMSLGFYVGGVVPVGYAKKNGRLVKSPSWDADMDAIMTLEREGLSTRAIAKEMTSRGVPMSHMTVYNLLTHGRKTDTRLQTA